MSKMSGVLALMPPIDGDEGEDLAILNTNVDGVGAEVPDEKPAPRRRQRLQKAMCAPKPKTKPKTKAKAKAKAKAIVMKEADQESDKEQSQVINVLFTRRR